ncbi:serine/threonine-protein kinase VRK1 isoform X1 [Alosa sapidissima]|uniref:serine/threonine-protein kinase VRK1 isoform X1 n=1 Tax=Alosa sapidissima TaxID=34773 RepID=UPI001C092B2F|nr:serine/threonine-protein kinase VRK1 isoform X1 [Alosa sapidissima]XP_041928889.1 serine/threonine-protein kinase VRK1 isoform X1 [Alosa sapidissima]
MPPKAKTGGRGPAKRKLAEEFPPGEILTDSHKKRWKLGSPIGQGGFGLLYLANEEDAQSVGQDAPYVIKVEPSENGPLFCELKFYQRAARPDLIQTWMKSHKLKHLGVPRYWGSGLHNKGGKGYRFMVMDRFGTDLQKKFEENGKKFPHKLVLQLGLKLLDVLEYIHEHEYVHADIKASNLLLSYSNPNQVFLVDYGLAYRYAPEGQTKDYKEDPKRCHDGTIEFTSIDAHKGVSPARRGDLEILGYCMVQWLCGRLPWEDKLQDPVYVRDSKLTCRDNIGEFMKKCFPSENKPDEMVKFMEEVKTLGYSDKPPYEKLRTILLDGLKSIGASADDKLNFSVATNGGAAVKAKTATKRKKAMASEDDSSPVKKRRAPQKKEANGVKKTTTPKKRTLKKTTPKKATPKKATPKKTTPKKATPKKRLVDSASQTSPMPEPAKKPRGRAKKAA